MRIKQLEAKLEDLGVIQENDFVLIADSGDLPVKSVYINVVSRLSNHVCYIFQENKLVMVEGNDIHVSDILKLKDLDLEEFE